MPPVQTSFAVQVDAYALVAPPSAGGDPLAAFPADFDDLTPGTPNFIASYGATPILEPIDQRSSWNPNEAGPVAHEAKGVRVDDA